VRVAEVEPLQPLGDDDRAPPVGREVKVAGSATGRGLPGSPVRGSIGVSVLPLSLSTHSVRRSHDGVTCWGSVGTLKRRTTLNVAGSISSTALPSVSGT
jgi:hypothetical protein